MTEELHLHLLLFLLLLLLILLYWRIRLSGVFPSNGRPCWFHNFFFEQICHNMIDEWWIGKDLEGNNRGLIKVIPREFACRNWGKLEETLVRVFGVKSKIRTQHVLNTSPERYPYTNPFDSIRLSTDYRWLLSYNMGLLITLLQRMPLRLYQCCEVGRYRLNSLAATVWIT
jgi:hypothetical protein